MEKETIKDKQLQNEAGATLLDEATRFKIDWHGIKIPFGIRPLHPATIVKISMQETRLKDVSESENMIHEMLKSGSNMKVFCRIIALAILNNQIKIALFTGIMTRFLMWNIPSTKDIFTLTAIRYRNMGAEHFFFTMQLTKGMNFLKKRTPMESNAEAGHSGVQSP